MWINGFGPLVIRNDSINLTFNNCIQTITYQKNNIRHKAITGRLTQTYPKYHILAHVVIHLLTNDDVYQMLDLLTILNNYTSDGMYAIFNYTAGVIQVQYAVSLNGDVGFTDLAYFELGQVIELDFISNELVYLPFDLQY